MGRKEALKVYSEKIDEAYTEIYAAVSNRVRNIRRTSPVPS